MIVLNNNIVAFEYNNKPKEIKYINFDINKNYSNNNNNNPALYIDFRNDFNYSINCIKKLIKLEKDNISFSSKYDKYNVKYIISNYNDEIICALKAICIDDTKEKYTLIYDYVFDMLDKIWKEKNPCKFCNNYCIATRNKKYINQSDGCCYSFEYSNNIFSLSPLKNKQKCKYLNPDKSCATKNLSCKFFTCKYLRKNENFNLDMKDYLLIQSFFSKKQQLILKYNFFRSKEEIIDKLLEKNHTPYFIYDFNCKYRIK